MTVDAIMSVAEQELKDESDSPVLELPDEVLQTVFSHLRSSVDLLRCTVTCRRLARAASPSHVWRTLYETRWGREEAGITATDLEEEGRDNAEGWMRMTVDREWREMHLVGVLDDMVWPDRRSSSREKIRELFGPAAVVEDDCDGDGDRRYRRKLRRNLRVATYALDNEVGWNGEKRMSRSCHAVRAKLYANEFFVCSELRRLFPSSSSSSHHEYSHEKKNVQICEHGAILIARLLDNDLDETTVTAALDKLGAEFRRRLDASGEYGGGGGKTMNSAPLPAVAILNELFFDPPAVDGSGTRAAAAAADNTTSSSSDQGSTSPPSVDEANDLTSTSFVVPRSGGLGFKGNTTNYYDRWNSSIASVLRRRTGIPITMTIMYAAVARRAGLDVRFLNIPGHFMAMVCPTGQVPGSGVFHAIDVFTEGKVETLQEAHIHIVPTDPEARDVCFRVLNNLRIMFNREVQERDRAPFGHLMKDPLRIAVLSAMIAIHPAEKELTKQRLELALHFGYSADARNDLSCIMSGMNVSEKNTIDFIKERLNTRYSHTHVLRNKELLQKRGGTELKIFPMGTVFLTHTHDQDERRPAVVLEEIVGNRWTNGNGGEEGDGGGRTWWKSAYRFCPLRRVDGVVVPEHQASVVVRGGGDDDVVEELRLEKLPEEVTSDRDHMLVLGQWFDSFDARRGVFVLDAYHRWLFDGESQ